jgi:hypothetical protein
VYAPAHHDEANGRGYTAVDGGVMRTFAVAAVVAVDTCASVEPSGDVTQAIVERATTRIA